MLARLMLPACLSLGIVLLPGPSQAETHGIIVLNRTRDTIRRIQIAPAGATSLGENRLRSQLPPNAEARIGYSTGCAVDVRLGFDSGRVETYLRLDACSNSRVLAGDGTTVVSYPGPARTVEPASKIQAASPAPPIALAPVPPWTGHSITKRFGGLDQGVFIGR